MRPMELRALTWREIDWKREQITIRRGRVKGQEAQTKTKSSMRTISMHPEAKLALEELQARSGANIDDHICLTKKDTPFNKAFDQQWSRAIVKAGIKHRKSYQLRHTWALMALDAGESPAWVAAQLGHTTMSTLFKHYARWIPNKQAGNLMAQVSMTDTRLQKRLQDELLTPA
jgi:integrase